MRSIDARMLLHDSIISFREMTKELSLRVKNPTWKRLLPYTLYEYCLLSDGFSFPFNSQRCGIG
jgi:hypothetical protein